MTIKHDDIIISKENPFENCKLNRQIYASILSDIISSYREGFVLSINGQWGSAKTTFVKMWEQQLKNNDYKTLYFNAWENDLLTDPSVAILGELKKLLYKNDERIFNKILKTTATVTRNIIPSLGKAIANHYIDNEIVTETIENALSATTEILEKEIEEYCKRKKGIDEFKELLTEYVKAESPDKPIVFIIDELDRCRPSYAVEVLEKVKHFFSVNGIVFILSIDKSQMCNSIKGFYGSESIDSEDYLLRFIDLEYRLPEPDPKVFCEYLYDYFDFKNFFNNQNRLDSFRNKSEDEEFIKFAAMLANASKLTLRQLEKLFAHSRIALKSFEYQEYVTPPLFFFLVYVRNHKTVIYNKIKSKQFDIQELVTFLETTINVTSSNSTNNFLIVELLVFYMTYCNEYERTEKIVLLNEEQNPLFSTKIKIEELRSYVRYCDGEYRGNNILKHLLNKIELYSRLIS